MRKIFGGFLAVAVTASSALAAPIPMPSAYWDYDNLDGQTMGNFDGFIQPSVLTPNTGLQMWVEQYNGRSDSNTAGRTFFRAMSGSAFVDGSAYGNAGASSMNYRNPGAILGNFTPTNTNYRGAWNGDGSAAIPSTVNAASPPPEHYAGGAPALGGGTSYHYFGGTHYNYDPTSDGNPVLNPQTDALVSGGAFGGSGPQTATFANLDSFRDRTRLDNGTGAGTGTSPLVESSGGMLAYSFWLNVAAATRNDPNFSANSNNDNSWILGRNAGGNAGSVGIRYAGSNQFKLNAFGSGRQMANDANNTLLVNRNEWNHFVIQYDLTNALADNGNVTLYLNGGSLGDGDEELFANMGLGAIAGGLFRMGNSPLGENQNGSGDWRIDDFAVWQGVILSPADVLRIYELGIEAAVVPEPSSVVLAMMGLASLFAVRRRKRA